MRPIRSIASASHRGCQPGCIKQPGQASGLTALVSLLLPILLSAGCAAPRLYYSTQYFESEPIQESDRSDLVVYLDWMIRSQKIKQLTLVSAEKGEQSLHPRDETSPPTLDWLPLPVLLAANYTISPKRKGSESDLLVHTEAEGYTPVSVHHELDGSVRITMGQPLRSLLPPPEQQPSPQSLVARFGIRPLQTRQQPWRPLDLFSLEQALALLSPVEQSIVRGIAFVRDDVSTLPAGTKSPWNLWAQYRVSSRSAPVREIVLFDNSPGQDLSHFVGEPDHPYPVTAMCLLHEVGHAIADYARVRILEQGRELLAAEQRLRAEKKILRGADLSPERAADLQRREGALRSSEEIFARRALPILQHYAQEGGPVLAGYVAVRGSEPGPTRYGSTSDAESFAESFALYKADPAALQRIYPRLFSWFASNRHILLLREALGENV